MGHHKLLTKEIEKKLPPLYATESTPLAEKMLLVKYFLPGSSYTAYAAEYSPEERMFWGLVKGQAIEWGYFSLDEMEKIVRVPIKVRDVRTGNIIQGSMPMRIERDMGWPPRKAGEVMEILERGQIARAGKAPQRKTVEKALQIARGFLSGTYSGIYRTDFYKTTPEGNLLFYSTLHGPDGQKVWAEVDPRTWRVKERKPGLGRAGAAHYFLTPSQWKAKHSDFKDGTLRKDPRALVYNARGGGTESWPVTVVAEGDPRGGKLLHEIRLQQPTPGHAAGSVVFAEWIDRADAYGNTKRGWLLLNGSLIPEKGGVLAGGRLARAGRRSTGSSAVKPHVVGQVGGRDAAVDEIPLTTTKELNAAVPSVMGFKLFWVLFNPPGYEQQIVEFMAGQKVHAHELQVIKDSHPVMAWTSWVWAPKEYLVDGKRMKVVRTIELGDPEWFGKWLRALGG
ncbi:MAG: hypothetical protein PHC52_00470 [Syntrophales bacterium]|nr:hypothetical protein [Syntrophales bacterium]